MQAINQNPQEFDLELDTLLADAVKVAEARKTAKKQGTRTDPAIAAIVREADVVKDWEPQYAIARFVETHCNCGSSHRRFDSWYILSSHRREATARRFIRSPEHCSLPAWQYVAEENTSECAECLSNEAMPFATIDLLIGIGALGEPALCCLPSEGDMFPEMFEGEELCEEEELEYLTEQEALLEAKLDEGHDKAIWEELENAQ